MEIEGIIVSVLPPVKGTSARGEWTKQEVILEQPGEFGRKVCVSFWGDKALDAAALRQGEKLTLSVNVESREFNGRWYTEVRVWKMTKDTVGAGTNMPPAHSAENLPPMPASDEESVAGEGYDDLPF